MSLRGTMLSLKDKHQELQKEAEEALLKVNKKVKVDSAKPEKKLGSKKKQ